MTPFYYFYPTLRLLTGDNDPYGIFDNQDGQLDGALRSVVALGLGPDGFLLDGDVLNAGGFTPAVTNGNDFALIAYEAAVLLIGGDVGGGFSYRTRALSASKSGEQSRTLMAELKMKIFKTRNGSNEFSTLESFATWIRSVASPFDVAIANTPAPIIGSVPQINIGLY